MPILKRTDVSPVQFFNQSRMFPVVRSVVDNC